MKLHRGRPVKIWPNRAKHRKAKHKRLSHTHTLIYNNNINLLSITYCKPTNRQTDKSVIIKHLSVGVLNARHLFWNKVNTFTELTNYYPLTTYCICAHTNPYPYNIDIQYGTIWIYDKTGVENGVPYDAVLVFLALAH